MGVGESKNAFRIGLEPEVACESFYKGSFYLSFPQSQE
jgi:hypothetical protein